jgi:aryl-alcohol dehydrogenase-like predicted oxidoreductase
LKYLEFGRTGLKISELCHGTLILGTLQADVPVPDGALAIRRALEMGVNFIDTAQVYKTYAHIREALAGWPQSERPTIASKSMAKTADDMRDAVEEALRELNADRIDIFLLHSVDSRDELTNTRGGAFEYLL